MVAAWPAYVFAALSGIAGLLFYVAPGAFLTALTILAARSRFDGRLAHGVSGDGGVRDGNGGAGPQLDLLFRAK